MTDYEAGRADERADWVRVVTRLRQAQRDFDNGACRARYVVLKSAEAAVDALLASAPKDAQWSDAEDCRHAGFEGKCIFCSAPFQVANPFAAPSPAPAERAALSDEEIDRLIEAWIAQEGFMPFGADRVADRTRMRATFSAILTTQGTKHD